MVRVFTSVLRPVLFWLHLAAGLLTALIVIIMSVTGVALTYQRQMQYWADTRHFRAEVTGAVRLPLVELIARVQQQLPDGSGAITQVTMRQDPSLPVALSVGQKTLYADPYNGHLHGEGTGQKMRAFFSAMVSWHRYLAMSGPSRSTGRSITGAANLVFLFIVLSGLYLWWPRTLSWIQLRNIIWFRGGLRAKARDFNWHNVLGFWSAIPLALVVYSGVVISYPWASDGVYRLVGEAPPARGTAAPTPPPTPPAPPALEVDGSHPSLDSLLARALVREPQWNIATLRVPATGSAPTVITLDRGDGGQPHLRATVTLDSATGAEVSFADFAAQSTGRQLRSLLRFAHTGEAGGVAGQTVAGLVSAASVVLVYTGFALSWRRFRAWWTRRRRQAESLL